MRQPKLEPQLFTKRPERKNEKKTPNNAETDQYRGKKKKNKNQKKRADHGELHRKKNVKEIPKRSWEGTPKGTDSPQNSPHKILPGGCRKKPYSQVYYYKRYKKITNGRSSTESRNPVEPEEKPKTRQTKKKQQLRKGK